MGRLTLNVLLSFAQFEREVTGERIRDKIAASKRKGMWMGGNLPLGLRPANRRPTGPGGEPRRSRDRAGDLPGLPQPRLCQRAGALARRARHHLEGADHPRRTPHRRPAVQSRRALLPATQPDLPRDDRASRQAPRRHAPGDHPCRALRSGADATRGQSAPACRPTGPRSPRPVDRPYLRCRRQPDVAELQLWPAEEALPLLCLGAAAAGSTPTGG